MKKYNLNLRESEELIVDADDTMEAVLVNFKEETKNLKDEEITIFNNWVRMYKIVNYDTIEGLVIDNIYKFNEYAAIIELTFRNKKEYDFLSLNPEDMTVSCMNRKENTVRNYIVRRLLIPDTIEEVLSFAKSTLVEEGMKQLVITIKELETKGEQYKFNLEDKFVENKVEESEPVEEQPKEEKPVENKPEPSGIFNNKPELKLKERKLNHEFFAYGSRTAKEIASQLDRIDEILGLNKIY